MLNPDVVTAIASSTIAGVLLIGIRQGCTLVSEFRKTLVEHGKRIAIVETQLRFMHPDAHRRAVELIRNGQG